MSHPPILSVSQVEDFDPEQLGGCPRRWWFERVQGHRRELTASHEDGHQGHALLARCLATGERPGRVRLGKAVNAVIDSGALPTPGPELQVERRFSGQPQYDEAGAWVPLDVSLTLWHAGHPWEGFIDLRFRRGDVVTVWDHKFSSDIHARALPADRLLHTVQMPIYALDSLREWPDAKAFNLVHLYVSRRGVESFVRQQSVTVEQVRERCAELIPLVQQMDAVRGVTAQDEVPFNRGACHARTGCPHQFRCNAFRRKPTMMELSDEEKALYGMLSDEKPKPAQVTKFDKPREEEHTRAYDRRALDAAKRGDVAEAERIQAEFDARAGKTVTTPLARPNAGPVTAPSDLNLDDIFEDMPKASAPKPQPAPTCEACSEVLTPENSSRLKTGDVKHIGCARGGITLAGGGAIVVDALPTASAAKCSDCPHPAHEGKACEGKRGRGACRCGESAAAPTGKPKHTAAEFQAMAVGASVEEARHLQAAAEQAKREQDQDMRFSGGGNVDDNTTPAELEEMGAVMDLARVGRELDDSRQRVANLEETLRTMREIQDDPELAPRGSWSGTLAVNVTVELGPSTLALIQSILKR